MNVFNRTFLGIYSLLWFAACVGLIAMAWNTNQKLDINVGTFHLEAFILSETSDRWIFTAGVGALGLIGLVTFFSAFRSSRPKQSGTVRVRRRSGASVDVTTEVVESLVRDKLEALPHIRQATPLIRSRGDVVETDITVSIDTLASISDVTDRVMDTTRQVLKQEVGADQIRRPVVHITYEELDARPAGRLRPQATPRFQDDELPAPPPRPGSGDARPVSLTTTPDPPREGNPLPPPPSTVSSTESLRGGAPTHGHGSRQLAWREEGPTRPSVRHEGERNDG